MRIVMAEVRVCPYMRGGCLYPGEGVMAKLNISRRAGMFGGTALVVCVCLVYWLSGDRYIDTDNAYIHAAKLMVTTDVSGLVQSVNVRQGQHVKKGAVLFRLNPQEFQHTVDADRGTLNAAALELDALKRSYQGALGSIAAQKATVRLAQITYTRDSSLIRTQAISQETMDNARESLRQAQGTLDNLQQAAAVYLAKLKGNPDLPLDQYPDYITAKANLAEAERELAHTVVRAPFDGVVGEVDALQPGALIVSSVSSFTTTSAVGFVSDKDIWIQADMKETKLTHVKDGDPVDITVDTYPGRHWHGHVEAINPGSDTTFSVLPSQNSSANWVKIVQRIAVRVAIDRQAGDPPLRAGMSVVITVDTGHRRWWRMLFGDHA